MGVEDIRINKESVKWECKKCYYSETCTDSSRWKICVEFQRKPAKTPVEGNKRAWTFLSKWIKDIQEWQDDDLYRKTWM